MADLGAHPIARAAAAITGTRNNLAVAEGIPTRGVRHLNVAMAEAMAAAVVAADRIMVAETMATAADINKPGWLKRDH